MTISVAVNAVCDGEVPVVDDLGSFPTPRCAVLEVHLVQHYHTTHHHCHSTPWWSHLPNRSSHPNRASWCCSRHARTVVAAVTSPEVLAVLACPFGLSSPRSVPKSPVVAHKEQKIVARPICDSSPRPVL